jgi:NhaP-type Na+/H+ or K+/H+ antiporter
MESPSVANHREMTSTTPEKLSGSSEVDASVFFLGFSLLLVVLARVMNKKFRIPYTPTLIIFGILIRLTGTYLGQLNEVVSLAINYSTESISLGLFPILIFGSSFSADWYLVKKEIFQIIPLATTVVVISTVLNAVAIKYILLYNFSWNNLILIGVILSATDHVAVSALLKDFHAKDSLKTLISGETMFNEALIFLIFKLFSNTQAEFDAQSALEYFFRITLTGLAFGIGASLTIGFFLKRVINDFYLEANIALVFIYLVYWLCEFNKIEASGGLALVFFGLYMSAYGKTNFSPLIEEDLNLLLEYLSQIAESIIFIMAGINFGDGTFYNISPLSFFDYTAIILVFLINILIRAIVLLVHFPLLKVTGYGLTWKELIILIMSGIKGTIASGLAITIFQTDSFDQYYRSFVIYIGIGNSVLSIIIAGTISKILHKKLGFQDLSDAQTGALINAIYLLDDYTESQKEIIRRDNSLSLVNWEIVDTIVGVKKITSKVLKKNREATQMLKQSKDSYKNERVSIKIFSKKFFLKKDKVDVEIRRRYLNTLKKIYWDRFKEGFCYGETSVILIQSSKRCLDEETKPMKDWHIVKKQIISKFGYVICKKLLHFCEFSTFFRKLFYRRIMSIYDSAINFIQSHQEAEKMIHKLNISLDSDAVQQVVSEGQEQIKKCTKFLNAFIIDSYPEIISEVQTKKCQKLILYYQKSLIDFLMGNQLIKKTDYSKLTAYINSCLKKVDLDRLPSMQLLKDILIDRFPSATTEELSKVIGKIVEKEVKPGEVIFSQNSEVEGAFFIVRGRVHEKSTWIDQELIIGNIVGVQHLLPEYSKEYTSTATAITMTVVALIPKEIIEIEGFQEDLYEEAREEIVLLNRERYDLVYIKEDLILRVIEDSKMIICKKGDKIKLPDGALVLKGKAHKKHEIWFISPSNEERTIKEDSILLGMPQDFAFAYMEDEPLYISFEKFCIKISKDADITILENAENPDDIESASNSIHKEESKSQLY